MTSTPQYGDYSIPSSPIFPPVPCVSRASSISTLNSLYDSDGERLEYCQDSNNDDIPRTPEQRYYSMSKPSNQHFTEDDLIKAFQDRVDLSRSCQGTRLVHDSTDPQSPWKRSIRLRYSDVNMRDSNSMALQEASDVLSQDMSSYVNSEDESVEHGSPIAKMSPAGASTNLNVRLKEALESLEKAHKNEQGNAGE